MGGTYWGCQPTLNVPAPANAVASPLCQSTYGESEPGQPQPPLTSGTQVWRVPVGTFTPFIQCGVVVANVVDPYDYHLAPRDWPRSHELWYDVDWNQVQPTC